MTADEIIEVFERSFDGVRLIGGSDEPFYAPADDDRPATIHFKEDFAASALHEISHWCIAGRRRRLLPDFGYWYEPERDPHTQQRFEAAESGPQALEWIFSTAANRPFRVSFDNFDLPDAGLDAFRERVHRAVHGRLRSGLPPRAGLFARALAAHTGCTDYMDSRHYEELPC